jgi:hypothetical protein
LRSGPAIIRSAGKPLGRRWARFSQVFRGAADPMIALAPLLPMM